MSDTVGMCLEKPACMSCARRLRSSLSARNRAAIVFGGERFPCERKTRKQDRKRAVVSV